MIVSRKLTFASAGILSSILFTTGCNLSQFSAPSTATSTIPTISGRVHGAQQPVSNATIQLYAANTTTLRGPATPLLTIPVMTDSAGNFTITGDYTCPTPNTLVYIVATGGNPGLPGNVNNTDLALMSAIGTCSTLTSSTFLNINELTTVASVEALAPFMSDFTHIGTNASNVTGLVGAFTAATYVIDPSTGAIRVTITTGVTAPIAQLDTLADILAYCINSAGGPAGSNTNCGQLLALAGTGSNTNTIAAILNITQNPTLNIAQLYALASAAGAPFQPTLGTAPPDFSIPYGIALPFYQIATTPSTLPCSSGGYLMAIDTAQHIWIYTQGVSYDPVANLCNNVTGNITIYDNNGALLQTIAPGTGGLNLPFQMKADPFGNVWTANSTVTLSKFGPNGAPLSPAGGFPVPFNVSTSIFGTSNISVNNLSLSQNLFSAMSIDPSGNIWGIGSGTTSGCFIEMSNSGTVITPAGNFCAQAGNNTFTLETATDGSGNAWFLGNNSISKVSSSGTYLNSGVNTNGCFSLNPANNTVPSEFYNNFNLVYDRVHNQLWGSSFLGLGALRSDGTQAFCYANATTLPSLFLYYNSTPTVPVSAGDNFVSAIAVDGAGNLWFATQGESATELVGPPPTVTGVAYYGLNALDPNGNVITPSNANTNSYGIQPAGFGTAILAIDAYGNIWTVNFLTHSLVKIPGLAVPKNYQ